MNMEYREIMEKTIDIFHERANQYGDLHETLDRQARLATLILNKPITAYDIAMISHACKLGRLPSDRARLDSYVDGINYLAFAGMLATGKALEDEIAELAKKFAPPSEE
jgi:hypothetical protein